MLNPNTSDWSHFPDAHPATAAAFEEIANARYPRDAKKVVRRAGLLVVNHRVPLVEMDAVILAGTRKAHELTPHSPEEPEDIPMPDAVSAEKPWSPSDALQAMPPEPTWHSYAEYSQPNGDKEL